MVEQHFSSRVVVVNACPLIRSWYRLKSETVTNILYVNTDALCLKGGRNDGWDYTIEKSMSNMVQNR